MLRSHAMRLLCGVPLTLSNNSHFRSKHHKISCNHRLESAGLNALEDLLFKMLGTGREDSNVCLAS